MKHDIPDIELPEFAAVNERLGRNIEMAREAVSYRVGYDVELAGLEPVEREGHMHIRVHWRRKPDACPRSLPPRATHFSVAPPTPAPNCSATSASLPAHFG
jgi:hypothetical protein